MGNRNKKHGHSRKGKFSGTRYSGEKADTTDKISSELSFSRSNVSFFSRKNKNKNGKKKCFACGGLHLFKDCKNLVAKQAFLEKVKGPKPVEASSKPTCRKPANPSQPPKRCRLQVVDSFSDRPPIISPKPSGSNTPTVPQAKPTQPVYRGDDLRKFLAKGWAEEKKKM
jgi:hypothetical protein